MLGTVPQEEHHHWGKHASVYFQTSFHYMYHVIIDRGNEEDTDKISKSNDEDSDNYEDIFNDKDIIRVAQRVCLNRHEKNRLVEILPVQDYVGVLLICDSIHEH